MSDLDDLRSRMRAIEGATDAAAKGGGGGTFLKVTAFLALLSVIGFGGFYVANELNGDRVSVPIPTNEASQFPDDRDAGDTLALPEQPHLWSSNDLYPRSFLTVLRWPGWKNWSKNWSAPVRR